MNDKRIYKYNTNRRTLIATAIHILVMVAGALITWYMYVGGYVSAWFISLMVALIALMVLSIPRRIVVDRQALSIVCILEIAEIEIEEIASIRKVDKSECKWIIPLVGSCGFFGYFGYYLDLSCFDRVKFYATESQNLVEIVDVYDDRYYISSREADELIEQIEGYINTEEELNV